MRVACVLLAERRPQSELTAFAESCFRFSPQISIRPEQAVFIEVGASRRLYSEASLSARLASLASRLLKSPVRIAIADTAATALVAARYPDFARTRDLKSLPLAALQDYANPFAWDQDLEKRVLRVTCILESLGIQDLGGFAILPRASLASRLGKESIGLMARVWGDLEAPWPGFHPQPCVLEREETRDPEAHGLCADLEGCVFVLRGLVERLSARLRGRGERLSVLEVRFGLAGRAREWRVEFVVPQGSAAGILPVLREKLAYELHRVPLGGPVESIEIEVLETAPGAGTQRDFFSRKEEESEAWDALVARLSSRLGKERVFVALPKDRYLPERAYVRTIGSAPVVSATGGAGGKAARKHAHDDDWPDRPARVLKKPEPLVKEGRVLKTLSGQQQWKAVSWEGPEKLSGEWWKDAQFEGFHRDYYRVITEGGEQLWVFINKKAKAPAFYLHGYFD